MKSGFFQGELSTIDDPDGSADRWIVSYADFITLLFAFFVVMYSISSVNDGKFRVLSETLTVIFNQQQQTGGDSNSAVVIDLGGRTIDSLRNVSTLDAMAQESAGDVLADAEPMDIDPDASVEERVEQALAPLIELEDVRVRDGQQWVEVELPSELLFASGATQLSTKARPIIKRMADSLGGVSSPIRVEGFTDNVPTSGAAISSNWQLSAVRAAAVVEEFTRAGIDPELLSAVGFAEFHPIDDNTSAEGRQKNRRVVVAIAKSADLVGGKPISRSFRDGVERQDVPTFSRITKLPGYIGIF